MKRRAFTLAESLVGMFILAVAVLGVLACLIFAQRAERQAANDYQVAAVARGVMAEILANLRLSQQSFQVSQSCPRSPIVSHPELEYQIDDSLVGPRSKKVHLVIYYKNQQGTPCQSAYWTEVYNAIQD